MTTLPQPSSRPDKAATQDGGAQRGEPDVPTTELGHGHTTAATVPTGSPTLGNGVDPEDGPLVSEVAVIHMTDVVDSFTGHDENRIESRYGRPIEDLGGAKHARAALFGRRCQGGAKEGDAWREVLNMTQREVVLALVADAPADTVEKARVRVEEKKAAAGISDDDDDA